MLSSRSIRSGGCVSERGRKAEEDLALFEFACMATVFGANACARGRIAGVWIKRVLSIRHYRTALHRALYLF